MSNSRTYFFNKNISCKAVEPMANFSKYHVKRLNILLELVNSVNWRVRLLFSCSFGVRLIREIFNGTGQKVVVDFLSVILKALTGGRRARAPRRNYVWSNQKNPPDLGRNCLISEVSMLWCCDFILQRGGMCVRGRGGGGGGQLGTRSDASLTTWKAVQCQCGLLRAT